MSYQKRNESPRVSLLRKKVPNRGAVWFRFTSLEAVDNMVKAVTDELGAKGLNTRGCRTLLAMSLIPSVYMQKHTPMMKYDDKRHNDGSMAFVNTLVLLTNMPLVSQLISARAAVECVTWINQAPSGVYSMRRACVVRGLLQALVSRFDHLPPQAVDETRLPTQSWYFVAEFLNGLYSELYEVESHAAPSDPTVPTPHDRHQITLRIQATCTSLRKWYQEHHEEFQPGNTDRMNELRSIEYHKRRQYLQDAYEKHDKYMQRATMEMDHANEHRWDQLLPIGTKTYAFPNRVDNLALTLFDRLAARRNQFTQIWVVNSWRYFAGDVKQGGVSKQAHTSKDVLPVYALDPAGNYADRQTYYLGPKPARVQPDDLILLWWDECHLLLMTGAHEAGNLYYVNWSEPGYYKNESGIESLPPTLEEWTKFTTAASRNRADQFKRTPHAEGNYKYAYNSVLSATRLDGPIMSYGHTQTRPLPGIYCM